MGLDRNDGEIRYPQVDFSLDPWMNWLVVGCQNEESAL